MDEPESTEPEKPEEVKEEIFFEPDLTDINEYYDINTIPYWYEHG